MFHRLSLWMSLGLLALAGCTTAVPTAVPNTPTTVITIVDTPTLASAEPADTAVPPPTATSTPLSASVPDANTDDLLALVQAGLPANAYDGLVVLPLYAPGSERPLWAVHSAGFRNYELNPTPNHFLAIYTYENGNWLELARQNLNLENETVYASPDILPEQAVNQVDIDPAYIWLAVDGIIGAHGGTFQLLRFDGSQLHLEAAASNASPGLGYLEDLNGDSSPELVLRLHEAYIFCYACGVRYLMFQVWTWDAAGQHMVEVTWQPLPPEHPAYQAANRAIELAQADLWPDALAQIEEAERLAGSAAGPALTWNAALIRLYNGAWLAELNYSPYPLLTRIFYGDFAGALDVMRGYSHDQIFSATTPLIRGTVAEGFEQWLAQYTLDQTNAALAVQPDLAAAYFLRAWATFLQNPADGQIQSDLAQAAALDPDEPLFAETAVSPASRIQFAPGAVSAQVQGDVAAHASNDYVLRALAGQMMEVTINSANNDVLLTIVGGDGVPLTNGLMSGASSWQGLLPATQDYVIRVLGADQPAVYTLTVTIE